MNRYKPAGWRYESHKHSLAAKGIVTKYQANKLSMTEFINDAKGAKKEENTGKCPVCKRYSALKGKYCAECHAKVHGGEGDKYYSMKDFVGDADQDKPAFLSNHKLQGEGHMLRHRDIDSERQRAIIRLDKAMQEGNMTGVSREDFLKDDFKSTAQEYLNGHITKEQFHDEINRELEWHVKIHRKSLSPFDWAEPKPVEVKK